MFETEPVLAKFIDSCWTGSAEADVAAKTSKSGGAYSQAAVVAPGVCVSHNQEGSRTPVDPYRARKYYRDDELNKSS